MLSSYKLPKLNELPAGNDVRIAIRAEDLLAKCSGALLVHSPSRGFTLVLKPLARPLGWVHPGAAAPRARLLAEEGSGDCGLARANVQLFIDLFVYFKWAFFVSWRYKMGRYRS